MRYRAPVKNIKQNQKQNQNVVENPKEVPVSQLQALNMANLLLQRDNAALQYRTANQTLEIAMLNLTRELGVNPADYYYAADKAALVLKQEQPQAQPQPVAPVAPVQEPKESNEVKESNNAG